MSNKASYILSGINLVAIMSIIGVAVYLMIQGFILKQEDEDINFVLSKK